MNQFYIEFADVLLESFLVNKFLKTIVSKMNKNAQYYINNDPKNKEANQRNWNHELDYYKKLTKVGDGPYHIEAELFQGYNGFMIYNKVYYKGTEEEKLNYKNFCHSLDMVFTDSLFISNYKELEKIDKQYLENIAIDIIDKFVVKLSTKPIEKSLKQYLPELKKYLLDVKKISDKYNYHDNDHWRRTDRYMSKIK